MTIRRRSDRPVLRVSGLVSRPRTWQWSELALLPDPIPDLGELAEGFTGQAVPVRGLLERAEPAPRASHVTVESEDGFYRGVPLDVLTSKGWLAFGSDDGPLPRQRGGPLRLVVPEGRTRCWNVKAVVELRLTAGPEPDSVPVDPPH